MNKYSLLRGTTHGRAVLRATAFVLILLVSIASAAIRGLYVGNEFYPPSAATEATAKYSGFNRLFLFTGYVSANGDVSYNGSLLATNGNYVGNSTLGSRFASVKNDGRIQRIELCIGSWGSDAFANIRDLIASQGTGSGSILYRNFLAIKNATGINAIQYDDEQTYHASSAGAFGQMLVGMGLKVTLCPYNWNVRTFWQSVKSQIGANCDAIYLQCYDGGAGNNPADWNTLFGGFKVTPGLWGNTISSAAAITQFRSWQNSLGCQGGFMWLNGTLQWDTLLWGDCLQVALEPLPFLMIVSKATGKCADLIGGDNSDNARINQWSYDYNSPNQRWAFLPTESGDHFKLISYVSGRSACVDQDSTADGAQIHSFWYTGNNPGQQWDLVDAGNGWFKIRNVKSGKVLDIDAGSTANDAKLQQWTDLGGINQLWRLQPQGDYFIKASTGKYINVAGANNANNAPIIQYDWENNIWFKWRLESVGEGRLKFSSLLNLSRVISVSGGSSANNAQCVLYDYAPNPNSDQQDRMIPLTNGKFRFYFMHDGKSWDLTGNNPANSVPLQQYSDVGSVNQMFNLERIP